MKLGGRRNKNHASAKLKRIMPPEALGSMSNVSFSNSERLEILDPDSRLGKMGTNRPPKKESQRGSFLAPEGCQNEQFLSNSRSKKGSKSSQMDRIRVGIHDSLSIFSIGQIEEIGAEGADF